MRLLTSDEMKKVELHASKVGLSYSRMMENAGSACARYIRSVVENGSMLVKTVCVVCGKGNNGGDGFVVARKLAENGYKVSVVLVSGYPSSSESELMYKMAVDIGVRTIWFEADVFSAVSLIKRSSIVVDAIFGFSFYGTIRGNIAMAIKAINESEGIVFSLDVPSGVYCDSGFCDETVVYADHTIAISSLKPAHIVHPAADCCGEIYVANIGIPKESFGNVMNSMYTLSANEISNIIPQRNEVSNKGDFGHLLVVAGSKNMSGAAYLSAMGAVRSGVGLVTLAFPECLSTILRSKLTETIFMPLEENENGAISAKAIETIEKSISKFDAILVGPGLSVCDDTKEFLSKLVEISTVPLVIDADAINVLATDMSILEKAKCPIVLTPHPKEMSRISGRSVEEIRLERVNVAKIFSAEKNVFLILKGSNTVVACPKAQSVFLNASGNSGLAKGGSGDVLAGIVSALVAQKMPIPSACAVGTFVHGHCGDRAADRLSKMGMTPSDVLDELSSVWKEYE